VKRQPPVDLDVVLELLLASTNPLRTVVYRATAPQFATAVHLVSGIGAKESGQRWNPRGVAAVYAGMEEATALAECGARQTLGAGLPIGARARTLVVTPVEVKLDRVVTLSSPPLDAGTIAILLTEDHRDPALAPTHGQRIGAALALAGIQGISVPSAARVEGRCLVMFRDNIDAAAFKLPPDGQP
jgi:RES domain-containing protein